MRNIVIRLIFCVLCFKSLIAPNKISTTLFDTIDQLHKFADSYTEYPFIDNDSWLEPDYSTFFKQMQPGTFSQFLEFLRLKKSLWEASKFQQLMQQTTVARELNGFIGRFVKKITPQNGDQFVLFGNLNGAFHSLVRSLDELIAKKLIDKNLMFMSPHVYIVFNGNVANGSPYILETLTLIMVLMKKNPEQVFYLRGAIEDKEDWRTADLAHELQEKASSLSNEIIPLSELVKKFFNTLPLALYLVEESQTTPKNIVRISSWGKEFKELNEDKFAPFFAEKIKGVAVYKLNSKSLKSEPVNLQVMIINEPQDHLNYHETTGLQVGSKKNGMIEYTMFSGPTGANRRLYEFFYDAFSILTIHGSINAWTIKLCNRDTRKTAGFACGTVIDLVSGVGQSQLKKSTMCPNEEKLKQQVVQLQQECAILKQVTTVAARPQVVQPIEQKTPVVQPSQEQPPAVAKKVIAPENKLEEPIRVGVTLDLSRGAKDIGKSISDIFRFYFDRHNKKQTDISKKIQFDFLDDEYDPNLTKENVDTFINKLDTNILLGVLGSENFLAILDTVKLKKTSIYFPIPGLASGFSADLTNCIVFRPSYFDEAYTLVRYILDKFKLTKPQHIAFFYQLDAFGKACLDGALEALRQGGMTALDLVEKISYSRNDSNFSNAYRSLKKSEATVLIFFATPTATLQFILNADASVLQKNLVGISDLGFQSVQDLIKKKNLKIIVSNVVPNCNKSTLPIVTSYQDFANKSGLTASPSFAFEAYITAALFVDAIEKTSGPINKDTLMATMEKDYADFDFQGLRLKFDPQTRSLSHSIWIADEGDDWKEIPIEKAKSTTPPGAASPAAEKAAQPAVSQVSESEKVAQPVVAPVETKPTVTGTTAEPEKVAQPAPQPAPEPEKPAETKKLDKITVGTTLDLSRSIKQLGEPLRDGILLAFNEVNDKGGVNGMILDLNAQDDGYEPNLAVRNVQNFLDNNIDILLAPLGPITLESYKNLIEQKKILVLFPASGAALTGQESLDYYVRLGISNHEQFNLLINYVNAQYKPKSYLLFYEEGYGKESLDAVKDNLKKAGIERIKEVSYTPNTTDFKTQAQEFKSSNADAFCFLGAALAAKNLIDLVGPALFYDKIICGIHHLYETPFITYLKKETLKYVISTNCVPNFESKDMEIVKDFTSQAEKQKIAPSMMALYGYMAGEVFADLVGHLKGPVTKQGLVDLIHNTKNYSFKGLTLNFNPKTKALIDSVWIDDNGKWAEVKIANKA